MSEAKSQITDPKSPMVRVAVDTGSTSGLDSLTYEVPDGLSGEVGIGSCVLVPLGPRQAVGYVIGFEKAPENVISSGARNLRPITAHLDTHLRPTEEMLRLADWISQAYLCPLPRTVLSMMPGAIQGKVQGYVELLPWESLADATPGEQRLLSAIIGLGSPVSLTAILKNRDRASTLRVIRQLESKGYLRRVWRLQSPEGKPRLMRGVRLVANPSPDEKLTEKQQAAFELISSLRRDITLVELAQRYDVSRNVLESLEKKRLVEWTDVTLRRAPAFQRQAVSRPTLTTDQQSAVDAVCRAIDSGEYQGHLLHGVTASGKTEVYLRCIEHALAAGRTSLILLPEIAITTQVMNIFKSRFGDEVAVMHSALSAGERCDEWVRAEQGEAKVVMGARSAVFAPLRNIGLVIVDEEHDGSYKQDNPPRYNGRDAAIERARQSGAALVLGSATPSIETYYAAEQGDYRLLSMPTRVESRPMPAVRVADLRAERHSTIFSDLLTDAIRDHLGRKHQVMLLQNRRAYSTFLLCRDCGYVPECPNCAVTLKFHSAARKLSCHHCEHEVPAPEACPNCGGIKIRKFGIGTERVEEETRAAFPEARVLRMDRDTTSHKGAHGSILSQFRHGEADILVGTQMIAKGLDFPNVTLVGVISADTSLHFPDFSASERTFQLISQVSGRSGRGTEPGEVIVQTFDPENYAIQCAVNHDYEGFYRHELESRREVNYPPFASLINITARDADTRVAEGRVQELCKAIDAIGRRGKLEAIGPAPAVLAKLKGEYRWRLLLRSRDREFMLDTLRTALEQTRDLRRHLAIDIDPTSML